MEESEVASDKVVSDAGCLIQDIDLATQHILGLFEVV
jgi:hypothetical protein